MSLLDTASLIVTPNGYKEGTLYSVIPSDGSGDMSVVRATTATRVNSAGLVELVPYNLLSWSEDFSNADWTKSNVTISANSTTAPNGTLTADTLTASGGSNLHTLFWPTALFGANHTISVYAKKNTNDFLQIYTDFVNTDYANFDLANGTTGTIGSTVISSSIESVGNGWYRCSFVTGSPSSRYVNFSIVSSSSSPRTETNALTTSVYIWGAQLNEGTIKDYQKTETRLNIPRLDYSNGTCPSLLVEPQRTNVLIQSNDFIANWTNDGTTTRVANNLISPDGIQNATKITGSGGYAYRLVPVLSAGNWTFSLYLKASTPINMVININDVGGSGSTDLTISLTTSWTRFDLTKNITLGTTVFLAYAGLQAGVDYYFYGAQLEAGSYPTSYIPTTSASVTRNADVVSKTGISSLIGQTEGTMFVDAYITGKDTSNGSILFATDKVSSGAIMRILYTPTNALRFDVFDGTSFQCQISAGAYNVGDRLKIAGGYKANDFVMYVNGTQIGTDTSGSVPTTDKANINTSIYGDTNGSRINSAILWTTRLTNTQLAQLTTI